MTRSMTLPEVAPAVNNNKKPANQVVSKSSKPLPSESLQCTSVQNRFSPESLQAAISHLEQRQQASLGELVRKQEQERQRLREEFRRQQQELMADIYKLFPGLGGDMEDVEKAIAKRGAKRRRAKLPSYSQEDYSSQQLEKAELGRDAEETEATVLEQGASVLECEGGASRTSS